MIPADGIVLVFPDVSGMKDDELAFRVREPTAYQVDINVSGSLVLAPAEDTKAAADAKLRRSAMPSSLAWEKDTFELDGMDVLSPWLWQYIQVNAVEVNEDEDFGDDFLDSLAPKRFEDLTPVKKART
jgi:hypothetical protein